ncbi:Ig-like domain-containing protein, partial [Chloroflexota bacterium]
GDTIVIGANGDDDNGSDSGSAYLFATCDDGDWFQQQKEPASYYGEADFGCSASISNDTIVVGASGDAFGYGSAYVYGRNQGGLDNWGEVQKLTASDGAPEDHFGSSVSTSGDTIVIGAADDDDNGSSSGSAYVFERNQGGADNWGEVQKLTASDGAAGDDFGISVSISGDTIVIGAGGDDDNGDGSGSAYVFERNQGGADNWGEVQKLTASDGAAFDGFGYSVSVSGDTIVVGAGGDDDNGNGSGSAYVFERNQGGADNWGEVQKLTASDGAGFDFFGWSVSISGDTIVVGAWGDDDNGWSSGSAYIFERNQGGADNWGEVQKLTASDGAVGDAFGHSVSISNDTIVVGARWDDDNGEDSGSAYVFERNQGGADNWGEVKKLTASDGAATDFFGYSVSIGGETIVVGALGDDDNGWWSGSAYVFHLFCGLNDTTPPSVEITSTAPDPTNTSPIPVTVTFSEDVTGFDLGDIVVGNGEASNLSGGPAVYTFDVNRPCGGVVTVDIPAGVATALLYPNLPNQAASQFSITYDHTDPSVKLIPTATAPVFPIPMMATFYNNPAGTYAGILVLSPQFPEDNMAWMVDTENNVFLKSYDGCKTWCERGLGLPPVVAITAMAVAPDDPSVVAVACSDVTQDTVYISYDSGENFLLIGGINLGGQLNATVGVDIITSIALGPSEPIRKIMVGISDVRPNTVPAALFEDGVYLWGRGTPAQETWEAQGLYQDVGVVAFSPSFLDDYSIIAVGTEAADGDPPNDDTFVHLRDVTRGVGLWDEQVVYGASWPTTGVLVEFGGNDSPDDTQVNTLSMALPRDFDAADVAHRVIWIAGDSGTAWDDVYRLNNANVYDLNSGAGAVSSLAHAGTLADGVLMAGLAYYNDVYYTDNPGLISPQWYAATIMPRGSNNVQVAMPLNFMETNVAFCGTSGPDSAVNVTHDGGDTWGFLGDGVTGFTLGDIVVGNGVASNLVAVSDSIYTFDVLPTGGLLTVDIPAGVAWDAAGNPNLAAPQFIFWYFYGPPVFIFTTAPDPTNVSPIPITATFAAAVIGFELGDIVMGNGVASNLVDMGGGLFTFDVTPVTGGLVTVDIPAGVATDVLPPNFHNQAAPQFSITYNDTTPPMVTFTSPADAATDVAVDAVVTATFSEPMDALTITTGSFTLEGSVVPGTVTYDSGTNTATFTPDDDLAYNHVYTATLGPPITDVAGNPLVSPYSWSFTTVINLQDEIDATPPGGTLVLGCGTYMGNATIDKPITIIGSGACTVILGGITIEELTGSDVTIEGMTITGYTAFGIKIVLVTWEDTFIIRNNTLQGVPGSVVGIQVDEVETLGSLTIEENSILDNETGIKLLADVDGATIEYNDITGNSVAGLELAAGGAADAERNWWGDASGPEEATFNPRGAGNAIDGATGFQPWLTRDFDTVLGDNISYFGYAWVDLSNGWNYLSTPIALDPAADTWAEYVALGDPDLPIDPIGPAYYFDAQAGIYFPLDPNDPLSPCSAIFARMTQASIAPILYSPNLSIPSKAIYPGWNLVAPASLDATMPVEVALTSVYMVAGGLPGYSQVISHGVGNQAGWVHFRDGATQNMERTKGYWVFMVNAPPGTMLAGFTFTPLGLP